ncbi:uncharacterized protein LOC141849200 [Brevipalpus obovatus]|uniref:uncharacterized protein LOC141849200 n=1 Tax=Brevipalpus obovatus TaxID=246614 RepID=UPI003D9DFED5
MNMYSNLLFILFAFFAPTLVWSKCENGKNATPYVHDMVKRIASNENKGIRLPRRLLGDVYLKRGYIYGMESVRLMEEPVLIICHNETLGAIQPKLILENVTFAYDWVYGDDETWGTAITPSQRLYVDIDIEQADDAEKPVMLGLYITKLISTKFNVEINGTRGHNDAFAHQNQVALVTRTFIARDAGSAITSELSPKVSGFLNNVKIMMA